MNKVDFTTHIISFVVFIGFRFICMIINDVLRKWSDYISNCLNLDKMAHPG